MRALLMTACLGAGCHGDGGLAGGGGTTGRVLWRADVRPPSRTGSIVADSVHAYVYRDGLAIMAIRLRDHAVAWAAPSDETLDDAFSLQGTALCADNVIFGSQVAAYAVLPNTGSRRWKWRGSQAGLIGYGAPTCLGSTVFFATGFPLRIYAVDATNGTERWAANLNRQSGGTGFVRTPVAADGVVVGCTRELATPFRGMIVGLDAVTGVEKWRFEWAPQAPSVNASCVSIAIGNGTVVGSADDGRVFALGLQDGQLRWTAPRVADFTSADDERVIRANATDAIVGSLTGIIVGLDLATGVERWRISNTVAAISSINAGFATTQGSFVGVNLSGWALAFDAATGRELWRVKPTSLNGRVLFGPGTIVSGLFIAIGTDGVYALRL